MNPSQRLAFNIGFQKRAAEILTTKQAAIPMGSRGINTMIRGGFQPTLGPALPTAAQKFFGNHQWAAKATDGTHNALWKNRTPGQRAGIVGAGVYGYGAHERARAQQSAYDQFAEAHPIMAGLGRFMGVKRPGYGQALANNALYLPGIS